MLYPYKLLTELIDADSVKLASTQDIGCMKLSAIISSSTLKDYVDIYYILQDLPLKDLLDLAAQKYPTIDTNVILKALVYFGDIIDEPISFQPGFAVTKQQIEESLAEAVKQYQA